MARKVNFIVADLDKYDGGGGRWCVAGYCPSEKPPGNKMSIVVMTQLQW